MRTVRGVAACLGALVLLACAEEGTKPMAAVRGGVTGEMAVAALHRDNPADVVGQAHNEMLAFMVNELSKPGTHWSDMCGRLDQWLQTPEGMRTTGRRLPGRWRERMLDLHRASTLCVKQTASGAHRIVLAASAQALTPSGDALIQDIYAAVQTAPDPSSLATELAPVLAASFSLPSLDSAVVQSAIAVAQSSADFWYANNYAQMQVVAAAAATDLAAACSQGVMEGQYYEANGSSWLCQGHQWLQTAYDGSQGPSPFRVASLAPSLLAPAALSCPSRGALFAGILFADATGAVVGGIQGSVAGPTGILVGAVFRGAQFSGGGSVAALGVSLFCEVF